MQVLSLFTGAGGLDLGLEAADFTIAGCVERDPDCRATITANTDWPVLSERDIHSRSGSVLVKSLGLARGDVTVVAGGPPCQPFSKSGQWVNGSTGRMDDPRARTLDAFFGVVEAAMPRVVLLENVKGFVARVGEDGKRPALDAVEAFFNAINERQGTAYRPFVIPLDAADIGIPQRRERVFVVADRDGTKFDAPKPTHGSKAEQGSPRLTEAWDAIGDLDTATWGPELDLTGHWAGLLPSIPEGRNYLHHTHRGDGERLFGWRTKYWSFLLKLAKDRPSWTLQAQPGPATGPFHWKSRKLRIREMARLQTFPDDHEFKGEYNSARRQLGNAVPVAVGEALGLEIRSQLLGDPHGKVLTTLPEHRTDRPDAEEPGAVPERYLELVGEHENHPGPGLGPRAASLSATGDAT